MTKYFEIIDNEKKKKKDYREKIKELDKFENLLNCKRKIFRFRNPCKESNTWKKEILDFIAYYKLYNDHNTTNRKEHKILQSEAFWNYIGYTALFQQVQNEFNLVSSTSMNSKETVQISANCETIINRSNKDRSSLCVLTGTGSISNVYEFTYSDKKYVMKVRLTKKIKDAFKGEINLIKHIQKLKNNDIYNYISKYYTNNNMIDNIIIMENVGKNLEKLKEYYKNAERLELETLCLHSVQGLQGLHKLGVIHGDIKPENMCVFNNTIKYIDFGFCQTSTTGLKVKFTGSPAYMSLLLFANEYVNLKEDKIKTYLEKIDKWALGCSVYYLATGNLFINILCNYFIKRPIDSFPKFEFIKDFKELNSTIQNMSANEVFETVVKKVDISGSETLYEQIKELLLPTLEIVCNNNEYHTNTQQTNKS